MTRKDLIAEIKEKKSFLCVGLDPDIDKLPKHLLKYDNPIEVFCKAIIDATSDLCVAYKPNIAFFESHGIEGWKALENVSKYFPKNTLTIADAKRGDIGNTATQYAKAFFENMHFDSITLNAYMGKDAISPFLAYKDKWAIVLGLTSNLGSLDFQYLNIDKKPLYQHTIEKSMQWGSEDNLMFVVGATKPDELLHVRSFCPNHFLLVPGVGAQGGDLSTVFKNASNKDIGILVNVTRAIIYASDGKDFADIAREKSLEYQSEMSALMGNLS